MNDDLKLVKTRSDYEKLLFFRAMLFKYRGTQPIFKEEERIETKQPIFYEASEIEKVNYDFDFFYQLLSNSELGYINKSSIANLLQLKEQLYQYDKEKATVIESLIPANLSNNRWFQELFNRRMNKVSFSVNGNPFNYNTQPLVLSDQLHSAMIDFDYKLIDFWKNDECADNLGYYLYSAYSFLLFQNEYSPMMQEKYPNELMKRILNSGLITERVEQRYGITYFIKQIQNRNQQFH